MKVAAAFNYTHSSYRRLQIKAVFQELLVALDVVKMIPERGGIG